MTGILQATLCFVLDEENHCLMLMRSKEPHRNKWNGPGGKILPGEKPEQGCRRELKEETGLEPDILNQLGSIDCIDLLNPGRIWRLFLFTANHPRVEISPGDEGIFKWLPLDKVMSLDNDIVHNIPLFLPLLLKGIPIQGVFVYRDSFLETYSITFERGKGLPI